MPPISTSTSDDIVAESPLNEVSREELNELFARDPEELTKEDIRKIVPYYRRRYSDHAKAERDKAKKPKGKKKAVNPKSVISMDELGLK